MTDGAGAGAPLARFATASLPDKDRLAVWREVFGKSVARLDLAPIQFDVRRKEISIGVWDGLDRDEIEALSPTSDRSMCRVQPPFW